MSATRALAACMTAAAIGLLTACQLNAAIEIVPHGTTPDFIVTYDGDRKACVSGLTVTSRKGASRRTVWAIRRADQSTDATCRDRFTFGTAPAGYEVVVPMHPLYQRNAYEVSASGPGWTAVAPLSVP